MKKILLSIVATAMSLTLLAEGYQVNTLSAKQLGMGHTGVALKLGSQSLWFNPAAASHQESKFDFSAGVTGISATAKFTQNNYTDEPYTHQNNSQISTPLYLYFNYKATDDLSVGISLNTPFGSAINWGDNWAGAHLVQDISLQSYTLQPTVSYKFLNDKLSVGAGLMISWGTFDLSRSMFEVGETTNNTFAAMLSAAGMGAYSSVITNVGNNPLLSATLGGDAGMKMGVNLGLMYDINEHWSLGMSYRSKIMMRVDEGHAYLNYASDDVKQVLSATGLIPDLEQGTFNAELPLPATLSTGFAFRPTDKWVLTGEFQWVGWSAYDELNVSFNEEELELEDINSVKNYSNSIAVRLGAELSATDWMTARVGLYVDESPVSSYYLNPETPSMTKIGYTGGFSFMPTQNRNLSIDLAYGYVSSADPERLGSYPTDNSFSSSAFVGSYKSTAHMLSIGLGLKF